MKTVNAGVALITAAVLLLTAGCKPEVGSKDGARKGAKDWSEHTHGLPFVVGYEPGMLAAQQSGKPVLLFVTTTWCGWCKKLAADSFNDPEIRSLLEQFQLVLVDGDEEKAAARKLDCSGYPHIVLQTAAGKTLAVLPGYRPPAEFGQALQDALRSVGG